jgi:DNA repair exonuclease SbcCD ATPase subunit
VKKEERLRREVKLLKEKLARLCGVKDELEEALHAKDRLDKAVVSLEKKLERLECLLDIQQKKGIDQNAEHENEVHRLRSNVNTKAS